jgi:hypothetical protein
MSPWEVALICLEIPIIQKKSRYKISWFKTTINSNKIDNKIKNVGLHPIDIYISKPTIFENSIWKQCFKQYAHDRKRNSTYNILEKIGYIIYGKKKLNRFTNFHPMYNNETFL